MADEKLNAQNQNSTRPHGLMEKALLAEQKALSQKANPIIMVGDVFVIQKNLDTSKIKIDPKLKALIDSILN